MNTSPDQFPDINSGSSKESEDTEAEVLFSDEDILKALDAIFLDIKHFPIGEEFPNRPKIHAIALVKQAYLISHSETRVHVVSDEEQAKAEQVKKDLNERITKAVIAAASHRYSELEELQMDKYHVSTSSPIMEALTQLIEASNSIEPTRDEKEQIRRLILEVDAETQNIARTAVRLL